MTTPPSLIRPSLEQSLRAFFPSILIALGLPLLTELSSAQDSTVSPPLHAEIGQPAPDFTLTDAQGQSISLSQYKGKFVVLEWTEPTCPFVHKFYDGGEMQRIQGQATSQGVIWLRINSSNRSSSAYQTPEEAAQYEAKNGVKSTATLLDPTGRVGHLYGARTALHMFVINPQGILIYAGAIDSISSPDPADIARAQNYVLAALEQAKANLPVRIAPSPPYGCHIKY